VRLDEEKKCLKCLNYGLKRSAYCLIHCKNYDKFEGAESLLRSRRKATERGRT